MEHRSNISNNNIKNFTESDETPIIIDNPNRRKRLPNIKIICKDPNYKGLRKVIIEAISMSGAVHNCAPITLEDPGNG